jgi:hypothetical protein
MEPRIQYVQTTYRASILAILVAGTHTACAGARPALDALTAAY